MIIFLYPNNSNLQLKMLLFGPPAGGYIFCKPEFVEYILPFGYILPETEVSGYRFHFENSGGDEGRRRKSVFLS